MISLRLQLKLDPDTRIGAARSACWRGSTRHLFDLSGGARALDMNYRRGWDLIDHMNKAFGEPLVLGTTGGQGGAQLTDLGRAVVARFRALEAEVTQPRHRISAP